MITLLLISAIYELFSVLLSPLLPVANPVIIAKFSEIFAFMTSNFLTLGYYYLPLNDMKIIISTLIGVKLLSLSIKFAMKIFPLLTGGLVRSDKL